MSDDGWADALAPGDLARVSGRLRFVADVPSSGALHAAFSHSTRRHARIVSIDTSHALQLPGVVAVVTGEDIGERRFGRSLRDYPVLAVDRVLFIGQRVAAVAAIDAATARRAADLIRVEYEPLPVVDDPVRAVGGDYPPMHPNLRQYEGIDPGHEPDNRQGSAQLKVGQDVETALGACDEVFQHEFSWSRSHAAPLETHGCLVVAGDPRTYVYSSHKEPYSLQREMAELIGREPEAVVVRPVAIGGDFGAKGSPYVEIACYFLSQRTGRPVRTTLDYLEELTTTSARHPGSLRLTTGVREGRIHAHELRGVLDGGAFAAAKAIPSRTIPLVGLALGSYDVPNRDEQISVAYTNTLPGGHVRSPGHVKAVFAGESQMDMIARARHEDPVRFRLRHADQPQTRRVLRELGEFVGGWRAEAVADSGIGVAVFDRAAGTGHTKAECEVSRDGVVLRVGVPDQGAGMYETFRSLAAEQLRLDDSYVRVEPRGADSALTDRGAGASRVTSVAGRACVRACETAMEELGGVARAASGYWPTDALDLLGRDLVTTVAEVSTDARGRPAFGGLAIEIEVERSTGRIRPRRAALVVDGGEVLNPRGYRGQLEGGFVYGLSQAMFEDLVVEDGKVVTGSLADYKMACASDVPPLEIRLLPPLPDDDTERDVRAVGELANLGVAAALANAVDDAVNVRVTSMPITAEKVWTALRGQETRQDPARVGGDDSRSQTTVRGAGH